MDAAYANKWRVLWPTALYELHRLAEVGQFFQIYNVSNLKKIKPILWVHFFCHTKGTLFSNNLPGPMALKSLSTPFPVNLWYKGWIDDIAVEIG